MNGTNENKVDSLISELRSFGDRPPPRFAWKRIADELESAVKEEREMLREAATSKMQEGATIIDNRGQGNVAAMRNALESARNWCLNRLCNASCQVTVEGLLSVVNAALSVPPRQCDLGTAEDQLRRWRKYCENFHYCVDCPANKKDGISADCFANWSQIPYEEGDENEPQDNGQNPDMVRLGVVRNGRRNGH